MGHKKQNNSNDSTKLSVKNNNFLLNFKLFNKFNEKWDMIFNFCIRYFYQNNYSKSLINIIKSIHSNKIFCLIIFILASWFWSGLILNFFYFFMLVDSLIISLLILQNNSINTNSRRLAKNIVLIAISSMNLIGGIITLLLVSFIYMEYSKFIGRLIFKFIKFFIKIFGNIFPPIYILYPDIKLFNFEDPDMTIHDDKNKKHMKIFKPTSTESDADSSNIKSNLSEIDTVSDSSNTDTSSESSYSKKYKVKKNIKPNKTKKFNGKINKSNNSTFPTISTIKYDVFKDKIMNSKKK